MPSDAELVRRMGGGGPAAEAAFEALFARHQRFVADRLAGMVRHGGAADDLVQEVFLRLWTKGRQWDGRGDLRAWLGRIATNLALNHLRSVRRQRLRPLEAGPASQDSSADANPMAGDWIIDDAAVQPADAAAAAELHEQLARLVEDLPTDKRDVLRMVHVQDMNVREAAEELGIPIGTVKSRLHHAREALARQWRALQEELGDT